MQRDKIADESKSERMGMERRWQRDIRVISAHPSNAAITGLIRPPPRCHALRTSCQDRGRPVIRVETDDIEGRGG